MKNKVHVLMLILIMPLFSVPHVKAQKTYLADLSKWDSVFRIPSFTVPTASITSRSNNDLFQFNITLSRLVAISSISIAIETANLVFYYQPPLNQELIGKEYEGWKINETHAFDDKGFLRNYRPLNVVGSYAVYSTTKWGNQYKTGKLFHIYRPLLIDAKGKTSWATLNITKTALTITLPQTFLDSATYPVTVDPTFGRTTQGGSSVRFDAWWLDQYTVASSGTITSFGVFISTEDGSSTIHIGAYTDTGADYPNALIVETGAYTPVATGEQTVDCVDTAFSSGKIWIATGVDPNSGVRVYADSTGGTGIYKSVLYGAAPNPFPAGGSSHTWSFSIYATYTTGGQDLTFQLSQTIHITSSLSMLKEKEFSLSAISKATSLASMFKEKGFSLSEIAHLISSLYEGKEKWFSSTETATISSQIANNRELMMQLLESFLVNGNMESSKEIQIAIIELLETMHIYAPMFPSFEQIVAAIDYGLIALVVAVLALALTLALSMPNRKEEQE